MRVTHYFSPQRNSLELMSPSLDLIVSMLLRQRFTRYAFELCALIFQINAIGGRKRYFALAGFKVYSLQHRDLCIGHFGNAKKLVWYVHYYLLITCDYFKSLRRLVSAFQFWTKAKSTHYVCGLAIYIYIHPYCFIQILSKILISIIF